MTSVIAPPIDIVNDVFSLVRLLADPAAAQKLLDDLKAASDDHAEAAAKLAKENAKAAKLYADTVKQSEANDAENADLDAKRARAADDVTAAAAAVQAAASAKTELEALQKKFEVEVAAKEKELADRAAVLDARDEKLTKDEAKAAALTTEYEEKLAKLKSLAG